MYNRPHVFNDNPYSEFLKMLKYRPSYSERFGSIVDMHAHMRAFFQWYNTEHRYTVTAMKYAANSRRFWMSAACQKSEPVF